jgi:hypothetical protein
VVVTGEEATPETPDAQDNQDASEEDETITPDDDYTPIGPDSFRLYKDFDDYGIVPDAEVQAILDAVAEPYPVNVEFTSAYPTGLWGLHNAYGIDYWSMQYEGNKFDVTYSDGSTKTYLCVDPKIDGDEYWTGYFELDADGNPIIYKEDESGKKVLADGDFWDIVQGDGILTDENNKIVMVMTDTITSGGNKYYLQRSSAEIEVQLQWAVAYAEIRDSKGNFQAEYTGKDQTVSLKKTDILSDFGEVKAIKILSPSGGKIKDIGCHEITFEIDNSEGNFETNKVTGVFNIFPKRVKSVKVTNPKKNTVKVTWKYSGDSAYKANLKKIKGFSVMIYDTKGNFIAQKNVKKTKTAVTFKSSKLKKKQKYQIEVRAYTSVKSNGETIDFWSSEAVIKKITLKK